MGPIGRRFGFNAMPIVRAAGWAVFNQLHVTKAATGTREELARQGMLSRAVRVEPAPRGGWSWAWTYDDLASPNTARSLRRLRARQLREQRAEDAARRRDAERRLAESGSVRDLDVQLTGRTGQPIDFWMSAEQFAYWSHTHLTVDVVQGRGSGFSVEAPEGLRFLIRSRLMDAATPFV